MNAATSIKDTSTKLQKFDSAEMSVEDISQINNPHIKKLLETARKEKESKLNLAQYNQHSSSHNNNTRHLK